MTISIRIAIACILALSTCRGLIAQSPNNRNQGLKGVSPCEDLTELKKRLEWAESRLRDWAGLKYFAQENVAIQPTAPNEERVVFIGDSIIGLWYFPKYFPKTYLNRAIGGQGTGQMLLRFRKDVVNLKPKVVVILGGTNDLIGSDEAVKYVEENLSSMAEIANANDIRVVLASVLPIADPPSTNDEAQAAQARKRTTLFLAQVTSLNLWIRRFATGHGFTYVDFNSSMLDSNGRLRSDLARDNDNVHPNEKGYSLMAPLAQAAIKSALEHPSH